MGNKLSRSSTCFVRHELQCATTVCCQISHACCSCANEERKLLKAHRSYPSLTLWKAVRAGNVAGVEFLIKHGASIVEALCSAAQHNQQVMDALVRLGADVNAMNKDGKTALHDTARRGHVDVVTELIRLGADVNAADENGQTALHHAAALGRVDVVTELAQHGAVMNATDKCNQTPLHPTAARGRIDVMTELVRLGADVNATDKNGRTALHRAAASGHVGAVTKLIRLGADANAKNSDGDTALHRAAAWGHITVVAELIRLGADVNAKSRKGSTAVSREAAFGRVAVVTYLIQCGASVAAKSHSSPASPREFETPLTVAGRKGHVNVWQALLQAGAPVNVRSSVDGETPLISIARADFFPAVQQLIARGGSSSLCVEDARDDEYPLLPGSLATMARMCATATFEFEAVCSRLLTRLQDVCDQLQQRQRDGSKAETPLPSAVTHDTLVTFASILFRFCRLLFDIEKKPTVLARFVASRAILQRVHDMQEELKHFAAMHHLVQDPSLVSDKEHPADAEELRQRFKHALSTNDALIEGCGEDNTKQRELAVLLQHELAVRQREQNQQAQAMIRSVLQRFVQACKMETVPNVPTWFISPDDLEYYDWNLVDTTYHAKCYAGKWQSTSVVIEASAMEIDRFTATAEQWHRLSHPNVVKLYGACHIGSNKLFVYEAVPDAQPLHEFLHDASNRQLTWHCLHQAALGLQYLHDRGVEHGCLCPETIIVGSDDVVKLNNIGCKTLQSERRWLAPEHGFDSSACSAPADIYALGLCIWVAVTGGVDDLVFEQFRYGRRPKHPRRMSESECEYELIKRMCAQDPRNRVDITFVVRRLKQFALERNQRASDAIGDGVTSAVSVNAKIQSQRLDTYEFPDLGCHSIPNALAHIKSRCEDLPDTQWMLESVLPALAFVFELLLKRGKTPLDAEVKVFCTAVARLQRYVRTAVSNKSMYERMRSRKVAESHHLVYTQLDQLLDMLEVEATHSIRRWRYEAAPSILNPVDLSDVVRGVPVEDGVTTTTTVGTDTNKPSNSPSDAITLNHLETPPAVYERWTRDGLRRTLTGASAASAAPSLSSPAPAAVPVPTARTENRKRDRLWAWLTRQNRLALEGLPKEPEQDTLHQRPGASTVAAAASSLSSENGTTPKRPSWYLSLKQLTFSESSDQIGQGAFGAVYRGSWRGTPVVIKFMGFEEDIDTISTDLLLHEVRVWHRLNHPHVLKLYGASHVDKRYFVCEFAGNGELRAYLTKMQTPGNDHLTWQKLHEAALGLQYLHGMNVAHNDLKCDNIMVGSDHKAKLIDFGLSCLIGEAEIQIARNKIGAVNWRSPECLAGGRPSFASDVYSFAMCIIEAVSGEPPWGRNPVQAGQVRFWLRRGMSPPLPASMTPKQRNLIELMTKSAPSERVSMAFVVHKLEEIAQDASGVSAAA